MRVVAVDEEKLIDQMDAEALQLRQRGESVFAEYLEINEEVEQGADEYGDQHKVLRSMLNKPVQTPGLIWIKLLTLLWLLDILVTGVVMYKHT